MRVIRQGVLPETKLYRATCKHCGCEMEFTRKEAEYSSSVMNESLLKVNCPTCHNEVWTDL